MRISVIVPTFREAATIGGALDALAALPGEWEVIVSDGGSDDATVALAAAHPSVPLVLRSGGGRAAQCNDGLERATGDVVLVLHADSRLPADAHALIAAAVRSGAPGGNFALRFDGEDRFSTLLTRWYAWQRRRGTYYGDSSVWLTRDTLRALGGFREIPIMDDADLVDRLEALPGRTVCLPGPATTSSRRWRRAGVLRTWVSWGVIRWLFVAGVDPRRLARLYRAVRLELELQLRGRAAALGRCQRRPGRRTGGLVDAQDVTGRDGAGRATVRPLHHQPSQTGPRHLREVRRARGAQTPDEDDVPGEGLDRGGLAHPGDPSTCSGACLPSSSSSATFSWGSSTACCAQAGTSRSSSGCAIA